MPHTELTLAQLSQYFHLPMIDVARKLGVCATVLKKQCRKLGIPRWPHRKMKSFDKQIKLLESSLPRDPEDQDRINLEIQYVVRQRDDLMKDPARHMCRRHVFLPVAYRRSVSDASDAATTTTTETTNTTGTITTVTTTTATTSTSEERQFVRQPSSRRQSLSQPGGESELPYFESRNDNGTPPHTPTYISSLLPVPVVTTTGGAVFQPSLPAPSPIVMLPPMQAFEDTRRPRRLSASAPQPFGVELPTDPPAAFDALATGDTGTATQLRRKSTSYVTTLPIANGCSMPASAQVFSFPAEPIGPYVCQPQFTQPYQFLQQQCYNGNLPQPQQQCIYVVQGPQGPVFTTATPPVFSMPTQPQLAAPKEVVPMQQLQTHALAAASFFESLQTENNAAATKAALDPPDTPKGTTPDFSKLIFEHSTTSAFAKATDKPPSRRNSVSANF